MDIYLNIYDEEISSISKNLNELQEDLLYIQRFFQNKSLVMKEKKDKMVYKANYIEEKCFISQKIVKKIDKLIMDIDSFIKDKKIK